jgi:hypothetical protein
VLHGGAAFVWPIIQDYRFLSLRPLQINIPLDNALSKQNIRVSVPSIFTIGISTDENTSRAAAERLLGLSGKEVEEIAKEMILGQLRQVVVTMDIEEINADREMRQKKAEEERLATASEKVQSARALEEAYKAEQTAETARAERERATHACPLSR